MIEYPTVSRRTFVGGLAASLAMATTGSLLSDHLAQVRAAVPAGPASPAEPIGFRIGFQTRLDVMEAHAGLRHIPRDDNRFRAWVIERTKRLESRRGVQPPAQGEDPWRAWMSARMTPLEVFLPAQLRFPFYTHMPVDISGAEYGPLLRQRIRDGSCNGIFLYMNEGTPLAPTAVLDSITSTGPPVPILLSPKNVSDPVKLAAFMNYWADRPEWIPYVRVAFWQEPQGDFGAAGQPPISAWHQGVITLADAADRVGIASVAHVETWHLHPVYQPDGGIPRLLQFLWPVIRRLGGGISWSVFVFNERADAANNYVQWMNEFMATHFPYSAYGVSAYGDSVPPQLPPGDPRRIARADRIGSMFGDLDASRARYGGYYALYVGPDPTRNFWDARVEDEAVNAVDDLTDRNRLADVGSRDRGVLLAAEAAAGPAAD